MWVGKNGHYRPWRKDSVAREVGKAQTAFRVVRKGGAIYSAESDGFKSAF